MSGINYPRLALAALAAAVTFIVLEVVVEGLAKLIFRVSEANLWRENFGSLPEGARFQGVNILILLGTCLLLMWLYAVLRARFGAGPRAALMAAAFLWLFVLLLWVNFVNLGVFPFEMAVLSLLFNLFELPGAAIAGASVYKEGPAA